MTSYSNPSANVPTYTRRDQYGPKTYLLREQGDILLRESGGKILINGFDYGGATKNSASYTQPTKN